jgi:hypothetical protein
MQARTENLQAQLAAATTQLHDLQARQQQLEARNASLESFASTALSHDPLGPPVVRQNILHRLCLQYASSFCLSIPCKHAYAGLQEKKRDGSVRRKSVCLMDCRLMQTGAASHQVWQVMISSVSH